MARVFVYNIPEGEKLRRIRAALLRRGISCRRVDYADYGHPLGFLCGRPGFDPAPRYTGPDFTDEMLLLEGLSGPALSELLDELRLSGGAVALKAVLTDTNAAWSSVLLHAAILREHETMGALRRRK